MWKWSPENIHPESRFVEDLGFTSFDFMSMLGEIEDEWDIEVDQEKVVNIRTVSGEAVDYLPDSGGHEKREVERMLCSSTIPGYV